MRYCCLTMGSKPASGELANALLPLFQRFCEMNFHDDVIVGTKTEHHQKIIPRILKRTEEARLTLNKEKCICAKQEILL